MDKNIKKSAGLKKRHFRVRNKVHGTATKPRLYVCRSLRHISAQLIDDDAGKTLATVTSNTKDFSKNGGNIEGAKEIGAAIAKAAQDKSVTEVVFDRGGRQYHGRIKALADAARESGLKF